MTPQPDTIRIFIPLTIKRRNGRPRIVPPDTIEADDAMPDPRTLRAIARAWDWRRRLERGEAATLRDIADAEHVTVPYVSRLIRLAFLAPAVLEGLLVHRRPCAVSIDKLSSAALAPWAEQVERVFEE